MTGNETRISVSSCHAMKLLVTLILTASMLCAGNVGVESKLIGDIIVEPSKVINLANTTTYNIFCVLKEAPQGINSTHMTLSSTGIINSEQFQIYNRTTIVARHKLEPNTSCGPIKLQCKVKFPETRGFAFTKITLERPPNDILPDELTCVLEQQRFIHCQFPTRLSCNSSMKYALSTVSVNGLSKCETRIENGTTHVWDSQNDPCGFSVNELSTLFQLDIGNCFGNKTMKFNMVHDDIVRPGKPESLSASKVDATSANVTWTMPELNVSRSFMYKLQLISEFNVNGTTKYVKSAQMIFSYSVQNLIPYTQYTLNISAKVMADKERYNEDLYWSEYGSVSFKTLAHRPITAPAMVPGSYSLKKGNTDRMDVSVFWEPISKHLHNGTNFGYYVEAYSDSYSFTENVNVSTCTFYNLPLGHYRVRIKSFNDEGESANFSEIQIFPPMDNRQPQLRSVLKDGGYNVSWIAPQVTELSNYTLMYCHSTSQGTCRDTIRFVTIPKDVTSFAIDEGNPLNFAISANYGDNYSSELSWQQCVVAPRTSRLGHPKFLIESVTTVSMVVRMMASCEEHSFYERMQVRVRTMEGHVVFNKTYDYYVEKMLLDGLKSSTNYEVIVSVFDASGDSTEKKVEVCTAWSGIWILVVIILIFGAIVTVIVVTVAVRRLKLLLDIKVQLPNGLLEVQEDTSDYESESNSESESESEHNKMYIPCPTIPEEPEPIAEEIAHNEPFYLPEELFHAGPQISATTGSPTTVGGPYIEMASLIRSSNTGQPVSPTSVDCNGNYEQMHPPNKSSEMVVRSSGYVKIELLINRARTGNYTQTIV